MLKGMQSTSQAMSKRGVLASILAVVVVVAVLCVVDLQEDASQEITAAEAHASKIIITKTKWGVDKRNAAYYHDVAFPKGLPDNMFKDDTDPAMSKVGIRVREGDEEAEKALIAKEAREQVPKKKKKASEEKQDDSGMESLNAGNFYKAGTSTKHVTTHYNKALKKFNSVGSIWKTALRALNDYDAKKAKEHNETKKVLASDLDQYLSGTTPKVLLPKGDNLKKEDQNSTTPVTDYVEVKTNNPYTDMSSPGRGSKHEAEKKKKAEQVKKKKKEEADEKFPKQDFHDPVIKMGDKDPAFGDKADIAFTKAAARSMRL